MLFCSLLESMPHMHSGPTCTRVKRPEASCWSHYCFGSSPMLVTFCHLLFFLFLDTFGLMLAQVPSELSAAGAKCGVRSKPGPSSFQYSQKKAKSHKTQMSATVYKTHFSSLLFTVWGSCTSSLEGCWVQMMENHLNFGEKLTSSSRLYTGRRLKN